MAGKQPPKNALLASGGSFSLADSFGTVAPLPVLVGSSSTEQGSFLGQGNTPTMPGRPDIGGPSPVSFFAGSSGADDPFANLNSTPMVGQSAAPGSVELAPPTSTNSPPMNFATPVPKVTPPPAATPLIPSMGPGTPTMFAPPPIATGAPLTSTTSKLKRPVYAPDPFMTTSAVTATPLGPPSTSGGLPPQTLPPTGMHNSQSSTNLANQSTMPGGLQPSYSSPNLQHVAGSTTNTGHEYNTGYSSPSTSKQVEAHWFYKEKRDGDHWKPFGVDDSFLIEAAYESGEAAPVPVDGTRYDVYVPERVKRSVYWSDEALEIRRCTWFHRLSPEGRWMPYTEGVADQLEGEYKDAIKTGYWQRKVLLDSGDWVMIHSAEVIMHFPNSAANHGALDDWGQVQPSSDPALKPQVVHRGLDGLPEIPDSECETVDSLVFVVHGIGSACDIQFRSIVEVVDNYRDMTGGISSKHFSGAHLGGTANRVEFLPVNWHSKLHGEDEGTDNRLKPLTLRSIPKLRSFINDTLLDVLFYTSPVYCQTILDTVCSEINKVYRLYRERNPDFDGSVSMIGHSLGSLILFDLLSGQLKEEEVEKEQEEGPVELTSSPQAPVKPRWDKDLTLEEVFEKLGIQEHVSVFTGQGITMEELTSCSEEDLKEASLPLGPRKKLVNYLEDRRRSSNTGFKEFQASTVRSQVDYSIGPAGTGQPFVRYPKLDIQPQAFFAFGSPIGMFMAVRGIQALGDEFKLPTCDRFFNIFHPYDPVAYRMESLVTETYSDLRPVVIPHHKGRKRMHLELKETMSRMGTDLKQKVMDSLKTVWGMASTITGSNTEETIVEEITQDRDSPTQELENNMLIQAQLNNGRRIDYVLQEAPMESFNEYLWSLASHLCYWQSEDTSLLVLKELYSIRHVSSDDQLGYVAPPPPPVNPGVSKTVSMPANMAAPPGSLPSPPSFPSYPSPPTMPTYPSPQPFPPTPGVIPPTPASMYTTPSLSAGPLPHSTHSLPLQSIPPSPFLPPTSALLPAAPGGSESFTTPTVGAFSGPTPTFFSPSNVPAPSSRTLSYPKPVSAAPGGLGMDPTVPVMTPGTPLPPPPKVGMNPTLPVNTASSTPAGPPPTFGFSR